jgi:hypothetical protein
MGVGLTSRPQGSRLSGEDLAAGPSKSRKIIAPSPLPPAPPRIVPSAQGRWGWVDDDVSSSEKLSLQDLYPPAGEERDCGERTKGYRVNEMGTQKIIAAGPIPPGQRGIVPSRERTIGWSRCHRHQLTRIARKLLLQDLYPPSSAQTTICDPADASSGVTFWPAGKPARLSTTTSHGVSNVRANHFDGARASRHRRRSDPTTG